MTKYYSCYRKSKLSLTRVKPRLIGSQFGIQLYDWDGSTLIFNYNFIENGIGIDERQVTGAMAKGQVTNEYP